MRRAAFAAAVCGLALLAACGGGAAQNPHCASNTDCAAGRLCKASECVAPNQCPSTQASCFGSSACGAGSSCQGGCCAPLPAGSCGASADCKDLALPHCDSGACRACATNAECSNGTLCTPTGACLSGCAQDSNCPSGQKCFTSANGNWCGQCAHSSDCADPNKPLCNGGFCTGCSSNAECSGATPACNLATHTCAVCVQAQNEAGLNAACTDASKPACSAGACVACAPSSNDGAGKNAACAAGTPYCTPGNACAGCLDSTQCKSGDYCASDKTCRSPALTGACLGGGSACATSTTALTGSVVDLSARLDVPALAATSVTFTITAGVASFSGAGAPLTTTTATIAAGATATAGVQVHLDASSTSDVVVQAALGGATRTATIHLTTVPPALASFSSSQALLEVDQQATLTVTLTAAPASPVHVTLTNDSGGVATLGVTDLVISGATSAATTLTPVAGHEGTVTLHASYNGVIKDLGPIRVVNRVIAALSPAAGAVGDGRTLQLTVTLDAAPLAGVPVTVTLAGLGGLGTVNGGGNLTISNPSTTGAFNFVAGSALGVETISASAGGVTKSSAITVQPVIAGVTVAPNPAVMGQPATVTVTLDTNAAADTRVYLGDYNAAFGTAFKQNTYLPTSVVIPAGQNSATVTVTGCKNLPSTSSDVLGLAAWLPGSNEQELGGGCPATGGTTANCFVVCPLGAAAGTVGGFTCPDTTAAAPALCPLFPLQLDQPVGVPLLVTAALPYRKPATAATVTVNLTTAPTGCATFTQAGAAITSLSLALSAGTGNSRTTKNFTLVPGSTTGDCAVTATATSTGTVPSPAGTTAHYNLVAAPAGSTPADLILNKIDVDEGSKDVGEFIELYNPTSAAIPLAGYGISLLASPHKLLGATTDALYDSQFAGKTEYQYLDLGALSVTSVPAGGYLLLTDAGVTAPLACGAQTATGALKYVLDANNAWVGPGAATATNEAIADAPGGVLLVKGGAIVDGLSYGGPMPQATSPHVNGGAPFDWPQAGRALESFVVDQFSGTFTLVRTAVTFDNALDWRVSTTASPCAANTVTGP